MDIFCHLFASLVVNLLHNDVCVTFYPISNELSPCAFLTPYVFVFSGVRWYVSLWKYRSENDRSLSTSACCLFSLLQFPSDCQVSGFPSLWVPHGPVNEFLKDHTEHADEPEIYRKCVWRTLPGVAFPLDADVRSELNPHSSVRCKKLGAWV